MQTKILEIRDRATFIPVIAVKLKAATAAQRFYLRRVGYPGAGDQVLITRLSGEGQATADPFFWCDRTFKTAHKYIMEHFDKMHDGEVVDVEFILGEKDKPAISERSLSVI